MISRRLICDGVPKVDCVSTDTDLRMNAVPTKDCAERTAVSPESRHLPLAVMRLQGGEEDAMFVPGRMRRNEERETKNEKRETRN